MDRCLKAAVEANNLRIDKMPKTLAGLEKRYHHAGLGHLSVINGTRLTVMGPDGQYELGEPGQTSCKTSKGNSAKDGLKQMLSKYGRMDADQKAILQKGCGESVDFTAATPAIRSGAAAAPVDGGVDAVQ